MQLACVIGKDGRVSTVELVRGLDDRLNQSAEEALAKWGIHTRDPRQESLSRWMCWSRSRSGWRSPMRRFPIKPSKGTCPQPTLSTGETGKAGGRMSGSNI